MEELKYLEGKNNVLADCFSRLPRMDKSWWGIKNLKWYNKTKEPWSTSNSWYCHSRMGFYTLLQNKRTGLLLTRITTRTRETPLFPQSCNNNDTYIVNCLINLPSLQELPNPLIIINIRNHQLNDPWLQLDPLRYPIKTINNLNIICFKEIINRPDQHWKYASLQCWYNQ